ncbi:Nitrilotriacetate monooxygenase component B [hydrothermal vent metagenome]|uniref:Nitrilotriacetate monooxygenase component B n=1 Tax=hydrothermal vent metagenome TaxID=652676 RepID=A0A3B0TWU3_9ZZZZ
MFYEPKKNNHGLPHRPFKALVGPRPIGWISTLGRDGIANLAPYSFFNAVADDPPVVMFSSSGAKDSLRNAQATGEFVCNIVSYAQRDAMNASSANVPPGVDEFDLAGLAKAECRIVRAPRVAEAPAALECRTVKIVDLPGEGGQPNLYRVVFGLVVGIHIADEALVDGIVDAVRLNQLARLGYQDYSVVDKVFPLVRPGD